MNNIFEGIEQVKGFTRSYRDTLLNALFLHHRYDIFQTSIGHNKFDPAVYPRRTKMYINGKKTSSFARKWHRIFFRNFVIG